MRGRKDRFGQQILSGALVGMGTNHLLQRHYADAEALLRECLTISVESQVVDEGVLAVLRSRLGGALLGQKKYAEAEPLLRQGADGLLADARRKPQLYASGTPRRRDLTGALNRLVQLYDATDKQDEAARWRKELERVKMMDPKDTSKR
jgi:hypothetical protein